MERCIRRGFDGKDPRGNESDGDGKIQYISRGLASGSSSGALVKKCNPSLSRSEEKKEACKRRKRTPDIDNNWKSPSDEHISNGVIPVDPNLFAEYAYTGPSYKWRSSLSGGAKYLHCSEEISNGVATSSIVSKLDSNPVRKKATTRKGKSRDVLTAAEKKKECYKRRTSDNTWKPPRSVHRLLQEEYAHDPWKVLVICVFLNCTTGGQVKKVLSRFFDLCPDAETCIQVPPWKIENIISSLGILRRVKTLQRLSSEYLNDSWTHVPQLHGVGKYAADAYAIFCTGGWREVTPKDHKLVDYWRFLHSIYN
ncbi:methyl-CpG-binding domain protein 4-like protein [Prosopis cineraria]|uniref:methyl-CpG-binding domain protein 4-like protein n=1 Tax=Prosopis cineraria TaxID=364024 RepID=UPI00240EE759|nr:methyl-CpG-binding domain protein 4-like protein [Prosopis cineraria]